MQSSANIYTVSRKRAGFTQEHAAEMLGISCRCLCDYETNVRPVPNSIVELMIVAYDDRLLALQHLHLFAPSTQNVLPNVHPGLPFGQTVCRLVRLINDFVNKNTEEATLMMIAEDGVVSSDQADDYKRIISSLRDIITAALEVEFSKKEDQYASH